MVDMLKKQSRLACYLYSVYFVDRRMGKYIALLAALVRIKLAKLLL